MSERSREHEEEEESRLSLILLAVSAVLVLLSFIPMNTVLCTALEIIAVLLSAYPILLGVAEKLPRISLSELELMFIAISAACCLGQFREAAAVGILYRIGEILEDKAIDRSRKNIDAVSKIQQDFAHLILPDGTTEKVRAEEVEPGSKISVLPHERFPIDGIVYKGTSTADASAVTGESMPVELRAHSPVFSGMINGDGAVSVLTTKKFSDSTASRIIRMVDEAAERKGKTQTAITKFAKYYTPAVVGLAVIIAVIGSAATKNPAEWIRRALVFLVASCPCALVISVPLGFYSGLGAAAKNGILVKGTAFAEAFAKAQAIVFDKTGTLTTDGFEIEKVTPADGVPEQIVLTLAGIAEKRSSHPLAKRLAAEVPDFNQGLINDFREEAGLGVTATLAGKKILCGSKKLLEENGIDVSEVPDGEICVALDGKFTGSILMKNSVRPGAADMVENLKSQGIKAAIMLTGDNEKAAKNTADECGLDGFYSGLLPEEKLKRLEKIKSDYGTVVYVGDGINDAPVLAASDAGIAMGLGTQAANEAADIILINDDLSRIAPAHKLFKQTVSAMKFNIIFSIAVKLLVLILGAVGAAPIWLAVFADVGVCLICIFVASLIGK